MVNRMEDINIIIDLWVIENPYPHIENQKILECYNDAQNIIKRLMDLLNHIFEESDFVRREFKKYLNENSSNNEIKDIFNNIRKELSNKFFQENNSISLQSYEKLINILIYNCYIH